LVALIAGAGAVAAALLIPADDRTRQTGVTDTKVAGEPGFTVIGDGDEPSASPSPKPEEIVPVGRVAVGSASDSEEVGGSSITAVNGEFAESSEGEDEIEAELEAEEEEEEQEQKEREERQERHEDRDRDHGD
jgi:hypothetical protein